VLVIFNGLWRHKIITFFIGALTGAGVFYVLAVVKPVYEASASYAFFNPPGAPSQSAIDRDPSLADISPDNPFTRFADQSVVVDILARSVSSTPARRLLVAAGADKRYTVAPSPRSPGWDRHRRRRWKPLVWSAQPSKRNCATSRCASR
jgi:hypothetical protein